MDARNSDSPLQSEYAHPLPLEYTDASSARPAIGITDILWTLRQGWRLPLVGLLIGLMVGVGYIASVKTPYKSSARILIDRSMNRYLQTNKIIDQPTLDDTEIGGQIYMLSSDSVVVQVVRSMKLTRDSEFVGRAKSSSAEAPESGAAPESNAIAERTAVEAVLKRLTVFREDVANVINVTFESESPNKAADIANALADTYIATTLAAKLKSTKIVSQWLQERLIELRGQVANADRALQDYRTSHNLLSSQNSEVLANLKIQLTNARIAVSEAKERLDRIQRTSGEGITTAMATDALHNTSRSAMINYALSNSDLVKLRAQYRDLAARESEVESRVGPKHSAVVKLREQLEALRTAIRAEEQRISDAYVNEYEVAKTRVSELAASATQWSGETEASSQLRELESAAETLRNLYNGFLQKYKEINSIQADALPVQNAHIITRAVPPLYKSSKKAMAVFAGSLMLGLFLGAGAAVGREWVADVFQTPKAVQQVSELDCVALPMVERKSALIEEHVLAAPYSRFAESLRNIKVLIDTAQNRDGAKVIGVVSSVPKEGKTIVAANLAALIIASSGARTLIIDSDLHLRTLTDSLAPDAREGLIEALDDPSRLATLVSKKQRSGLDVLPCVSASRIPNAAELLGSAKMGRLLAAARKSYDYIIIEIAPIMSVVDVKMIERFIDGFILVVEWGQTKRTLVLDALSYAQIIRERLIAVVLNKIDPVALRTIEAYKGAGSGDYYQE